MTRRNVAILGATGSIGCNTLEVIRHLGDPYRAVALSGHKQLAKLVEQAKIARPSAVAVADEASRNALSRALSAAGVGAKIYAGPREMCDMVRRDDVDVVVAAIVGFAGLEPVLAAVEAGKTVALANKEALVVAGSILIPLARKTGAKIIPVDSEHSAIFQAMACGKLAEVSRIILTASGGPFRDWSIDQMCRATREQALDHPTWQMGEKITIDSATLFNKALEIIEACWLFDVPPAKIDVVIHPESIVHSMVEFVDGSTIAQLSPPDMRTPIQYALTWPDRCAGAGIRMDWSKNVSMTFSPPDVEKFPSLHVAYEVAERRGTSGAALNAANEIAVASFLSGEIDFGMISDLVARTIADHHSSVKPGAAPTMEELKEADRWARQTAESIVSSRSH